jgi:hypothetical protein
MCTIDCWKKKIIKLLFDVRLQQTKKIQGTVLTGNAQNKLKLKMKFPRAADDTCTSSVRPQNKRYRIKTQLLSYRRRIYK